MTPTQRAAITQPNRQPNILVVCIQALLALACLGALARGIQLSVAANAFAGNEFMAALTALVATALTLLPGLVRRLGLIPMPALLETAFVVFVYLAMFFGEMLHFYDLFPWWDSMLHLSSGVLFALVGYMLFLALNKDPAVRNKINPACVVALTVIFAIACGVLWEIFEYAGDSLLGMNMQRWQNTLPANEWAALQNVSNLSNPGLMDTMKDFINDTIGAFASIPIILPMVKKSSLYTKTNFTCNDLLREMEPVKPRAIPQPAPAALCKQGPPEKGRSLDAA
ncbi:MAG: hypothetical protein ACK5L3_14155 [Oscillospiraceae bacterium]